MSALGLAAATLVKSPAQVAAETRAPAPTVLTAVVERKALTSTVVMRGTATSGATYSFAPDSVAATADGPGGGDLVVTRVRAKAGQQVRSGAVVVEVSERPVVVLRGAFPAYRDLIPGESGGDVAQLRRALAALGYRSSDRSGYFGVGTQSAVRRFYRAIGYPPALAPGPFTSAVAPSSTSPTPTPHASPGTPPSAASSSTAAAEPLVMVPKSEVVFLPRLPARLSKVSGSVGSKVSGDLLTFATGQLTLTGKMAPEDAPLVERGSPAAVLDEVSGYSGRGTVDAVGKQVRPADGSDSYIPVVIAAAAPWPSSLAGEDVRVTITNAKTQGPVLAVPEAAVSARADGRSFVTRVLPSGSLDQVEVTIGASADGYVEVAPDAGLPLAPGDHVVTGQ